MYFFLFLFHSCIDRIAVRGDRKRDEREGGDMQQRAPGGTQTLIKWGGPFLAQFAVTSLLIYFISLDYFSEFLICLNSPNV